MARRTTPLPQAPLYRILRKVGANRVSEEAKREFVDVVVDIAERIASRAVELAKHAKRKTVQEEDVKLAKKEVIGA
jgi:histone H3/H4